MEKSVSKNLIRVFVSIDMPDIVKAEIKRIQDQFRKIELFEGSYVKPEVAHLTLQFIGYIEPLALTPIKKLLSSIEFSPIEVSLGRLGVFGNHSFVRILWMEVLGDGISDLAHSIEKGLSLGTVALRKPFQSHLTLVRVKSVKDVAALRKALAKIDVTPISFTINDFVLKQSNLTPEGPVYVDLERYKAKE